MIKEELIKLIKSLPHDKCLVTFICGRGYILSCKEIETSAGSRCYIDKIIGTRVVLIGVVDLYCETTLYIIDRSDTYDIYSINIFLKKDYIQVGIDEFTIDKYQGVFYGSPNPRPSEIPFMTKEKVDNNTEVKKSVIFPDCPRNEKWSDETILNIVNFVNSGIVYDEKQYTIASCSVVGFLGDLADHIIMGHVWDIKNKRALVLKEKHKKHCLFFKNGKNYHSLDIIPNEEIVASYKVEGVL